MIANVLCKLRKIDLETILAVVDLGLKLSAPANKRGNANGKTLCSLPKCQPFAVFYRKNMTTKQGRVGHTQI